jgi:hypothetical protein
VNEGEFLLAKYGGTLTINGVEVTKGETGFPPFIEHEKYFLVLSKSRNGTVSLLGGPNGTYTVSEEGQLTPVNQHPHPLKEVIKQRFNDSVGRLKQQLKTS